MSDESQSIGGDGPGDEDERPIPIENLDRVVANVRFLQENGYLRYTNRPPLFRIHPLEAEQRAKERARMSALADQTGRPGQLSAWIARSKWVFVGALILLAIAHATRYEHVAWVTDGGAEIRWDRWLHRTCIYPVRGQVRCF